MNKKELIEAVAEKAGMPRAQAARAVDATLTAVREGDMTGDLAAMKEGEKVPALTSDEFLTAVARRMGENG